MFLDRDGTLNEEREYLRTPDELLLFAGTGNAVRRLNERGILTCVISNQSGVARGFLTEETLSLVHLRLRQELAKEGAHVDRVYYCPHHPTDGIGSYRQECDCRKPRPGMLLQGAQELGIDLQTSYVIGDSVVDMQVGAAVGASTVLVLTGYGTQTRETCDALQVPLYYVAPTIVEAVDFVLDSIDRRK